MFVTGHKEFKKVCKQGETTAHASVVVLPSWRVLYCPLHPGLSKNDFLVFFGLGLKYASCENNTVVINFTDI